MFGVQRYQMIPGGSVDAKGLQEIANLTHGKAYMASENKALQNVLSEINKLERTEVEHSEKSFMKNCILNFVERNPLIFRCELLRRVALKEGT